MAPQPSITTDPPTVDDLGSAYARLRPGLVRLAYLLTFDAQEAHDVVQECFVAALARWEQIENPDGYLRRAVTNRAFKVTRDRGRRLDKDRRHAAQRRGEQGEVEYLADVIAALPEKERAAVVLRYYADLPTREIAEAMGISPGSVGPTLTRALRRLERAMEP